MRRIAAALADLPGVRAEYTFPLPNRRPLPCVLLHLDAFRARSAGELHRALEDGDPSVVLGDELVDRGTLLVYPSNLRPGEAEIVIERIREVLSPLASPRRAGAG